MSRWLAIAGVVVVLTALTLAVPTSAEPVEGPAGSSYVTERRGAAAYHALLAASGYEVERLRRPVREARLQPGDTIVVLEPGSLPRAEAAAIARFVAGGGRAVLAGRGGILALGEYLDVPPRWGPEGGGTAVPVAPAPEVAGVAEVAATGTGSWVETGEAVPLLASEQGVLAMVAAPGDGRLVLLADATPLRNEFLAEADNAAFGLAIAGKPGSTVAFLESVHGFAPPSGLAALPDRWRWTLAGLTLAVLVWVVSRARRLGPPFTAARELPPPRARFVEALAAGLARTKRPEEAIDPVRAEARRLVALRGGLGPGADGAELEEAAGALGLDEEEIEALLHGVAKDAGIVAAGRALARLGGRRRPAAAPEEGTSE